MLEQAIPPNAREAVIVTVAQLVPTLLFIRLLSIWRIPEADRICISFAILV